MIVADLRILPEESVWPGKTWTRDVDYGVAKVRYSATCTGLRPEGEKAVPCAVLELSAAVTLGPEYAQRLQFEKMDAQMVVATDGTGPVSFSAVIAVVEKADKAEMRLTRSVQEKLVRSARLDGPAFQKVAADLGRIEKVIERLKADDLNGALAGLDAFLTANPQGSWTPAVQAFRDSTADRQILTKPTSPFRLRLILRDLQANRDRLAAQGATDQVASVDRTLRQLAAVNLKTLQADTADPDPVVRDTAAFGLTFAPEPAAGDALTALADDSSAQVRGTAAIGLFILGRGVDAATLESLLADADERVQGAGAFLAPKCVKKEDPQAQRFLPLLVRNLKATNAWTRDATVPALGAITPAVSVPPVVAALVAAAKTEAEPSLLPTYLQALKTLTGAEGATLQPYEEWMKQHPAAASMAVLPPLKPARGGPAPTPTAPAVTPTAAATGTAAITGTAAATGTTARTGTAPTGTAPAILPPIGPNLPVPKMPGIVAPPVTPSMPAPKTPGAISPSVTPTMPVPKSPDAMQPATTPTMPSLKMPEPIVTPTVPKLPPPKTPEPIVTPTAPAESPTKG